MSELKVGVIGLRFSEIRGEDPLATLMGIMPRNWAIYNGLKGYGLDTYLYVDPHAAIDDRPDYHSEKFIRNPKEFIQRVETEFDYTIIAGTRIHTTLEQHPWLAELKGGRFIWAQCYHNHPGEIPAVLTDNLVAAGFTSPRYAREFNRQFPGIYTTLLTTGQPRRHHAARQPEGDIIFVGHVHNLASLHLFQQIALMNPQRRLHLITSRIRAPGKDGQAYIELAKMEDDAERHAAVQRLFETETGSYPNNLTYHFLPHGEEYDIVEKASVGLSICHNRMWQIDNSKVCYYLSFGIPSISQLPSLSHRFCERLGAGEQIRFNASAEEWTDAINRWADWDLPRKTALRARAQDLFSWDNVAFEVYDMILEDSRPLVRA